MELDDRFWSKVNKIPGGCWEWTASLSKGYGQFKVLGTGKHAAAHRVAYASLKGDIPEGMTIDHMCWNRACVNPEHLRLATTSMQAQNQNGWSKSYTGIRGAYLERTTGRYIAQVKLDGHRYYLGTYDTAEEAGAVAREWRRENMPASLRDAVS